jgi:signal transduction histidine kinase
MSQFGRIRWRLAGWNLVVLGLVLAVTIGAALLTETRARAAALDNELRLGAEREVAAFDRDGDDDSEGESRRRLGSGSDLFAFWLDGRGQVVRNSRQINLAGLPDAEAVRAALGGRETLADRDVGGVSVRLLTVPVYHDRRIEGVVQVGKPLAGGQQDLMQLTTILLLTGAVGLVLSAFGSLFLADRAMRPILEAFERQRRFIADASHELRTPVAVLRARAEVLQREGTDLAPDHREQLQLLRRDADELSALLDELLDLARLDAGQIELLLEPVALADVVDETVAQLAALAAPRQVHLHAVTKPVWGQANLGRLRQVVRALVDNALKHTPAGGSVEVSVEIHGECARLRVIDTGKGIAPEDLPKVADRFYRADEARSRLGDGQSVGAGLGLAIAAELVRLMHGRFTLESTLGHGTVATVLLPAAPAANPQPDERRAS